MKENDASDLVLNAIVEKVRRQFKLNINSLHGAPHWQRVKEIGFYLGRGTLVDLEVIRLFALLHDSKRENEYYDAEHGARAAEYVLELSRLGTLNLRKEQVQKLAYACRYHSDKKTEGDDLTIQTCWDADRLDLYRMGEIPNPAFLYTEAAKRQESLDFALKINTE